MRFFEKYVTVPFFASVYVANEYIVKSLPVLRGSNYKFLFLGNVVVNYVGICKITVT